MISIPKLLAALPLCLLLTAILLGILVTCLLSCSTPNITQARVAAFQEALQASEGGPAPGSEAERAGLARIQAFLADLSPENVRANTKNVYAANAYFNDTLKTVRGAEAIEAYLRHTAETVTSISVAFDDVMRSGEDHYLRWHMDFQAPKLSKGEVIRTIGISQIRFDREGKVTFHQDYWDSSAGLFEHLPVSNQMINLVRKRL